MLVLPTHGSDLVPARLLPEADVVGDQAKGCVWLHDRNGRRYAALWPSGFTARFGPLRVYDRSGREVWRAGSKADVGGGLSDQRVDRIPPACRVGTTAWWVGEVKA